VPTPSRRKTMIRANQNHVSALKSMESFIDEELDFDFIYMELSDKDRQTYSLLFSSKQLFELITPDKQMLRKATASKEALIDYLKECLVIEREELKLENKQAKAD